MKYWSLYLVPLFALTFAIWVWHTRNQASPKTDEVTYVSTAYEVYEAIKDKKWNKAYIKFLYSDRPTSFQFVLWPFLHIFDGNYKRAIPATTYLFYLIFFLFVALLSVELWGKTIDALLATSVLASLPMIVGNNFGFNNELPLMAFATVTAYCLVKYYKTKTTGHLIALTLSLGAATTVRPMEAGVFLILPTLFSFIIFSLKLLRDKWVYLGLVYGILFVGIPFLKSYFYGEAPPIQPRAYLVALLFAWPGYAYFFKKNLNPLAGVIFGLSAIVGTFFYPRYFSFLTYLRFNTLELMHQKNLKIVHQYISIYSDWSIAALLITLVPIFIFTFFFYKKTELNRRVLFAVTLLAVYMALTPLINVYFNNTDTRYFFTAGLFFWLSALYLVSRWIKEAIFRLSLCFPLILFWTFLYSTSFSEKIDNVIPPSLVDWQLYQHSSRYPSLEDPAEAIVDMVNQYDLQNSEKRTMVIYESDIHLASESWNVYPITLDFVSHRRGYDLLFFDMDSKLGSRDICEVARGFNLVLFAMEYEVAKAESRPCLRLVGQVDHTIGQRPAQSRLYSFGSH